MTLLSAVHDQHPTSCYKGLPWAPVQGYDSSMSRVCPPGWPWGQLCTGRTWKPLWKVIHGSFNLKWFTVKLIKDLDAEGFRGGKYIMLVTTKTERMNREEAKTSRDDTYPEFRVSLGNMVILGSHLPPMNRQKGSCGSNWGASGPKWKSLCRRSSLNPKSTSGHLPLPSFLPPLLTTSVTKLLAKGAW